MSCDVALAFALHLAAFTAPGATPPPLMWTVAGSANPLASEPLFADIVRRAGALKSQADALRQAAASSGGWPGAGWSGFKSRVAVLSGLDMQGHLELARRGTDGDLKCILRGISQDLPKKLGEIETAPDPAARKTAMDEMFYLLRDNVEVITASPQPKV